MSYEIRTNRGLVFTINQDNFDEKKYMESLNDERLLMIAMGDIVMQKHNIENIAPKRDESGTLEGTVIDIHMGDGRILQAPVDEYNPNEVASAFNDVRQTFILIGDTIVNRRNVNMLLPADQ